MALKLLSAVTENSRASTPAYCFIYPASLEALCYLFPSVEFKSKYSKDISIDGAKKKKFFFIKYPSPKCSVFTVMNSHMFCKCWPAFQGNFNEIHFFFLFF